MLCNGGSYANRAPKFIAMCALLPPVLALIMAAHVRFAAPYGYALSCAKFTTPIIALAGGSWGWAGDGGGVGGQGERRGGATTSSLCPPASRSSFLAQTSRAEELQGMQNTM